MIIKRKKGCGKQGWANEDLPANCGDETGYICPSCKEGKNENTSKEAKLKK